VAQYQLKNLLRQSEGLAHRTTVSHGLQEYATLSHRPQSGWTVAQLPKWEPNYQSWELNHTTTPFGLLMLKGRGRAETDLGEQLNTSIQQGDMVLPQQHQSRTSCQLPSNQNHRPLRIGRGTPLFWKGIARGPCGMFLWWNCGYNHRVMTMDYKWQSHWPGRAWHPA
jgi:hypothetical protein